MSVPDHAVDPSQLLQHDAELSRVGWYAEPLTGGAAALLHDQARRAVQQSLDRSLIATLPPESQALVELVYGQLLISRKLAGALEHLDRGFTLAIPRLESGEYFTLLRRHELLRALPLHATASAAQSLSDLLTEARVIRRLQPHGRRRTAHPHDDTLG